MSQRQFNSFIFDSYSFDAASKTLQLNYSFDDEIKFCETYRFDFTFSDYNPDVLDRAIQALFFMAGVSYYKAYPSRSIEVRSGSMDQAAAEFFANTYQHGLGEYFFINTLDPKTAIPFQATSEQAQPVAAENSSGLLIGIGGGKDSLVSVELLKDQPKVATWSVGHRAQLEPLIDTIGLPHFWVERAIDPLLIELNKQDALNGHIPISAILGCVGTVVAVLSGYQDVVVSNENSANEPSLEYQGVMINHQYSKSLLYETAFQEYLRANFGEIVRYYSFLRPFSEVRIAELFAKHAFAKYHDVFSSCNRAFVQSSHSMSWCGKCPKCAFTFLALTPFVEKEKLEKIWGKNLLEDPSLAVTYQNLLGISGDKPLDCVGEIKESRAAMQLAQRQYPSLGKYAFEIPKDYNYADLAAHSMPEEVYKVLTTQL